MADPLSPQQLRNILCLAAAVLLAVAGTELGSAAGFGAAGVLLLVTLTGTICFAILSRQKIITRSLVFGASLLLYNGLRNSGSVVDFNYLQLAVPIFIGFPFLVALIARRLRRPL